jgi:hypothetical protein
LPGAKRVSGFPVIDPHFHLWDLDNSSCPWLSNGVKPLAFGNYAAINKTYLPALFVCRTPEWRRGFKELARDFPDPRSS